VAKSWYVLNVYSGHENKVEKFIRVMMVAGELGAVIDVKVPTEEIVEVVNGKRRVVQRKFLPGYVLLEMDLPDRGWKDPLSNIVKLNGVIGFVGHREGMKPQPISSDEAREILQKTGEIKADKGMRMKQDFIVGEMVKIVSGPFESFTGAIEDVNIDKGKLRVLVGIFGRSTPVEVDFGQVERA
jgi:transcriptional antiterminator NusG